jgi:hypothetical protein
LRKERNERVFLLAGVWMFKGIRQNTDKDSLYVYVKRMPNIYYWTV